MGYICGFDGENKALRQQLEKQCKEKSDCLICEGNIDPRIWFWAESHVIREFENDAYQKEK